MRASLLKALISLLLSDAASAWERKHRVAIEASEVMPSIASTTSSAELALTSPKNLLESPSHSAPTTVVVISTVTVIPMPLGTSSGVFYPGISTGTGIPSGIFWPGLVTGSGTARPTGYSSRNGTGNHTTHHHHHHHHHSNSTSMASISTQVPFFTLTNTGSLPLPTLPSVNTPEMSATVIPITSNLQPTITGTNQATNNVQPTIAPSAVAFSAATPAPSTNTTIPFLRGVNLGGWLVLEKWMDSGAFTGAFSSAIDQWTFDSLPGAAAALEAHWSTFITEEDIQTLAATGLNALRIPIGFWAYDNASTPYIQGADPYLEKAIGWARNASMKVWVDCHGSPGSQNGFDNSGHKGAVDWQQAANLERSISVLKTMAAKYGAQEYADVVVGLELTNEPISWGANQFSVTQSWAQSAYASVKAVVENENLVIVMHDSFKGAQAWTSVAEGLINGGPKTFGIDSHLYQLFSDSDNNLTQAQHITEACGWAANLAAANAIMPTYVGEWSAATNICVNPDGSTTAGTSCSVAGCQCQSADFSSWNSGMIEQVRRFVEAQLDVYESSASGYFIWAAKGPGGWGFLNGIGNGAIPNPVTSRKYPGQCGSVGKRRAVRGMLGVKGEAFYSDV